ncbi:MAG: hypothetical protein AUJ52_11480 [Elusimicrobia bacterium CG1_02_63_36]|nr:MAG: hypothetical protein AUJ52_11480 [Elusimicrobia bacterium CG1_02_63_36]
MIRVTYYAWVEDRSAEEIVLRIGKAGDHVVSIRIDSDGENKTESKLAGGSGDLHFFDLGAASCDRARYCLEKFPKLKGRIWVVEDSPTVNLMADGLKSTSRDGVFEVLAQARHLDKLSYRPDHDLHQILREMTTPEIAAALRTAEPRLRERCLGSLSRGVRSLLREMLSDPVEPSEVEEHAAREMLLTIAICYFAGVRIVRAARILAIISFAVLLGSYGFLLHWANSSETGLSAYQSGMHAVAILIHAAALSLVQQFFDRPGIPGVFLIGSAAVMVRFQAGMFSIGFWPEVGLLGSAGLLCVFAHGIRSRRFARMLSK